MPDHRLVRGNRYRFRALAEYRRHAEIFHLVVLGRAGAMWVDVVDVVGAKTGIRDGVTDAADDGLAVGARAGAVERIRHLAAARQHAENLRAACNGGVVALEHDGSSALRHDEAVAVLGERLGRRLRRGGFGLKPPEKREAGDDPPTSRTTAAEGKRRPGSAPPRRLDAARAPPA